MAEENKNEDPNAPENEVGTTGHSWDGITELNTPLPRWWLWTFYATIVWGIIYTIFWPAWPLVNSATQGILGEGPRGDTRVALVADLAVYEDANREIRDRLVEAELTEIRADADLQRFANRAGAAIFRTWCAQCHGAGGAGVQAAGYPNLQDDAWLWGGSIEDIHYTITHGIRNEDDPDARWSEMPAFGDVLEDEEITSVVAYVQQISGQESDATLAAAGAEVFLDQCSACHGEEGMGDPTQGAPNLTDAIWLYGGDAETITETVRYSRFGVMPHWSERLSEAEIRAVATYVHTNSGGE